jgi:MFS family permease
LFVWPDRTLLKLGLIAFCSMMCEGTRFDWSGIYFTKEVISPEALNNLGFVAFMATMTGGRFAGDWIVARFGTRRVIQANGLLIALGLLMAVIFPNIITATLGFLLVGMGVSTIVPLVYSTAGKSNTMSAGMALAAVSSTGFLGFLLGPPLIGYVAEMASLRWSFGLVAMLGILTAWLISRVHLQDVG